MRSAVCTLILASCLAPSSSWAAQRELPDELTLKVGEVGGVGSDVTLVLTKRSLRSENYLCGVQTPEGFKSIVFPVSTYRGYVQGDPAIRVNANIEPGGILNANLSAGLADIGRIRDLKVDVGQGKSTATMSAGHKVVPLASLAKRKYPTPSGCLVPPHPMRLSRWVINLPGSYTSQHDLEKVISRVEQRWNDADYVFARDVGTAWEIETIVIQHPAETKGVDWNAIPVVDPGPRKATMHAHVTGVPGRNNGKLNSLGVAGDHVEAGILLHEGAHLYGNPYHQMDPGDALFGGGAFFGRNNVQVLVGVTITPGAYCHRGEEDYPGVTYGGVLPPSAMRDMVSTRKDTAATFDVLENDYDGNGDTVLVESVTPVSEKGGTLKVAADRQRVEYTPAAGFVGLDQFTYTAVDGGGAANKSGIVKVNVRPEGLGFHCGFEDAQKDGIDWLRARGDFRIWCYDELYKTPEAERVTYHFPTSGPYGGPTANALWINHVPVKGIRGDALFNGGQGAAQVDLTDAGDPGRDSLTASLWVLFPGDVRGGVILCKSSFGFKTAMCGWAIQCTGKEFSFFGNTVNILPSSAFELHTEQPIEPKKWYHLVMVIDREAKRLRAYVNNQELTASSSTPNIPDEVIEYHAKLRLFNGPGWKGWRGTPPLVVDEVKLFASALSPQEIAALYAEGKDAPVPEIP